MRRNRPIRWVSAAVGLLLATVTGCAGVMELETPGPGERLSAEVSRAVLTTGEVIRLEQGRYELGPTDLVVWDDGLAAEAARTIARTDIARFEGPGGIDAARTAFAVIVLPLIAVAVFVAGFSLSS